MARMLTWILVPILLLAPACPGEDSSDGDGGTDASADARIVDYDGHTGVCLVSADCPPNHYCDLGVCLSDCDQNTPCGGGMECSAHGRCLTSDEADEDPPLAETRDDTLVVTPSTIQLERDQEQVTLSVSSEGGSPFRFRAASGVPWIGVSHQQATDSTGQTTVTVDISRGSLDNGSFGASVRVVSDIGTVVVPIAVEQGLGGRYAGTLEIVSTGLNTRLPLMLDVKDFGNELWARITPEGSPTFSAPATGIGTVDASGNLVVSVSGLLNRETPLGEWRSDYFGRPVGRTVVLTMAIGESNRLSGTFEETITGMLGEPYTVSGNVFLARQGGEELFGSFLLPGAPQVPNAVVTPRTLKPWCMERLICPNTGNVPTTGVCENASQCLTPSDPGCPTELEMAVSFMNDPDAVSIYGLFSDAVTQNQGFPTYIVGCCADSLADALETDPPGPSGCAASCIDPHANECVLTVFEQHLAQGGTDPGALDGEIQALKDRIVAGTFVANDQLVDMFEARVYSLGIQEELSRASDSLYTYAWIERQLFEAPRLNVLSMMPFQKMATDDRWDLFSKLFGTLARSQQSLAREALLRRRMPSADPEALRTELNGYAEVAYLKLTTLGEVLRRIIGTQPTPTIPDLASAGESLRAMAQTCAELGSGRNPLGFSPEYVPIIYREGAAGLTNYEQYFEEVSSTALSLAENREDAAISQWRQFEDSEYQLSSELLNVSTQYNDQLAAICGNDPGTGEPDVENCGTEAGEMKNEHLTMQLENEGLRLAQQRIDNLKSQVQIELNRASAISSVRSDNINMILQTGEKMAALTMADSILAAAQTFLSIASNSSVGNAGAPMGMAAASAIIQVSRGVLAAEKDRLQAMQGAHMEASTQQIEEINSLATVKTMLLQMSTLVIEQGMQSIRVSQSAGRIAALQAKVKRLQANMEASIAHQDNAPVNDPSYRLARDKSAIDAEYYFEIALAEVYKTARAFEYETNLTYPCIESKLYEIRSAADLRAFMSIMDLNFTRYRDAYGNPQQYVDEISVREDILGIKQTIIDPSTGEEVSPQEQFRRVLLAANNLDPNGDVFLDFTTSIAEGNGVFNHQLCNDRIRSIQVMLVGDFLGDNEADVMLVQSGSSMVRACDPELQGAAGEFVEYNYGLAAPYTGLYGNSVAYSSWRLVFQDVANNADLDLTQLDDIVIKLTHEALTLSQGSSINYNPVCTQ